MTDTSENRRKNASHYSSISVFHQKGNRKSECVLCSVEIMNRELPQMKRKESINFFVCKQKQKQIQVMRYEIIIAEIR